MTAHARVLAVAAALALAAALGVSAPPAAACSIAATVADMMPPPGARNVPTNARIAFLPDSYTGAGQVPRAISLVGPKGTIASATTELAAKVEGIEIAPDAPLAPNTEFSVRFMGTHGYRDKLDTRTFTTTTGPDMAPPKLKVVSVPSLHPTANEGISMCPPSHWLAVDVKVDDASPAFVVLVIRDQGKAPAYEFAVPTAANAGALSFRLPADYDDRGPKAPPPGRTFSLFAVDVAGNRSPMFSYPGGRESTAPQDPLFRGTRTPPGTPSPLPEPTTTSVAPEATPPPLPNTPAAPVPPPRAKSGCIAAPHATMSVLCTYLAALVLAGMLRARVCRRDRALLHR